MRWPRCPPRGRRRSPRRRPRPRPRGCRQLNRDDRCALDRRLGILRAKGREERRLVASDLNEAKPLRCSGDEHAPDRGVDRGPLDCRSSTALAVGRRCHGSKMQRAVDATGRAISRLVNRLVTSLPFRSSSRNRRRRSAETYPCGAHTERRAKRPSELRHTHVRCACNRRHRPPGAGLEPQWPRMPVRTRSTSRPAAAPAAPVGIACKRDSPPPRLPRLTRRSSHGPDAASGSDTTGGNRFPWMSRRRRRGRRREGRGENRSEHGHHRYLGF